MKQVITYSHSMYLNTANDRLSLFADRSFDLDMAAAFNAQERTLGEWESLFSAADSRFVLKGVTEPEGSALGIIEVVWDCA